LFGLLRKYDITVMSQRRSDQIGLVAHHHHQPFGPGTPSRIQDILNH
jgi:hypothetical protein